MPGTLSKSDLPLQRRDWLQIASAACFAAIAHSGASQETTPADAMRAADGVADRTLGLLLGSAIGDALGGPVEFQPPEQVRNQLPDCRSWPKTRQLDAAEIAQLTDSLRLLSYAPHRPDPEPYGQWQAAAAPGTVTDDTRMKMVLMSALTQRANFRSEPLRVKELAAAFVDTHDMPEFVQPGYAPLREESFREFTKAAQWVLGQRDAEAAAPPERIWGGLPTCCGQMILPPLAGVYAGQPERAYRNAFAVSFFDQGTAKDTNAAIVAGLAVAVGQRELRGLDESYRVTRQTMIETDPFGYGEVPFITRPIVRWLELAEQCVEHSEGRPAELYHRLQSAFHPHYYWEARFTFGAAWALLKICDWNCLAAMHLALDLGHDTDSVAQLIGALGGAIQGATIFPTRLTAAVTERLAADYGVSLTEWSQRLARLRSGE